MNQWLQNHCAIVANTPLPYFLLSRDVMHKFTVDLPKKHGRGGQSALRFARLRMEKRHNYVRKVAETAVQLFISNDKPNISGMILAGSADFKTELSQSDMFDPRLQGKIIKLVDVSYGGNFLLLFSKDFVSLLRVPRFPNSPTNLLQRYFLVC